MNSAKRKAIRILPAIFVAAIMIVTMVVPALAQQGPEIRVTHFEDCADQPDPAVDSNGNVHIAYCDSYDTDTYEIWYTMLDNTGNTLIDDTRITPDDDYKSKRPAIVVDSNDKVHIIWQDKRWGDGIALTYTKLDPYLDDRDGSPADLSQITLVDDKSLTDPNEWAAHPRIAIDSNDHIHIVSEDPDDHDKIYYMKIDDNGNVLIPQTAVRLTDEGAIGHSRPNVAVDSNNNAHIVWDEYVEIADGSWEVFYMMLDGSDGSSLIDATMITPADDHSSARAWIVADFNDYVHIVWRDKRNDTAQIFYTKLDPDPHGHSVTTLIDDTALTPDDVSYTFPTSAIQCGRYIHLTFYRWTEDDAHYLHYMILDHDGSIVVSNTALITDNTAATTTGWTIPYLDVDANDKAHITWCDDRDGEDEFYVYEVYYTSYQGPPCPAPSPVGVPTLSQWGAIGMIIALAGCIVWTLRKRSVGLNAS